MQTGKTLGAVGQKCLEGNIHYLAASCGRAGAPDRMHMPETITPADVAAVGDPGDDTGRRFDYQHTYAAILCCSLLDPSSGCSEVFCEHHEDILMRMAQGFQGVQVKTRNPDGDAWKATDPAILSALCRFVQLDAQWPGQFCGFLIATNHFFFNSAETGSNLKHLLELATQANDFDSAPKKLKTFIRKIVNATKATAAKVLATLKKTRCTSDLPKLDDIKQELRETICGVYSPAQAAVTATLKRLADALVSEARRAASLDHRDALPGYFAALLNAEEQGVTRLIAGKRIDKDRFLVVLTQSLQNHSLLIPTTSPVAPLAAKKHTRLEKKLEAGGLSAVSINAAKDLQASALHKFLEWREALGEEEALKRYAHIKTAVLSDCSSAHETASENQPPFGRAMLQGLKERISRRRQEGQTPLFDCLNEHLEGCAYELTNECKVWWSKPFPVNGEPEET